MHDAAQVCVADQIEDGAVPVSPVMLALENYQAELHRHGDEEDEEEVLYLVRSSKVVGVAGHAKKAA